MPTKNPRLNITFSDPEIAALLANYAAAEKKSVSNLAQELILEALDRREDMFLSAIDASREDEPISTVSHEDAWK